MNNILKLTWKRDALTEQREPLAKKRLKMIQWSLYSFVLATIAASWIRFVPEFLWFIPIAGLCIYTWRLHERVLDLDDDILDLEADIKIASAAMFADKAKVDEFKRAKNRVNVDGVIPEL